MNRRAPTRTDMEDATSVDAVALRWRPEDQERLACLARRGSIKVRNPVDSNGLCGGDFVLTDGGSSATLSFCFRAPNSKRYGLTVGHVADHVGQKLYAFASHLRKPNGTYSITEIGTVVSISKETDSLLFEIKHGVNANLMFISLADGCFKKIVLPPRTDGVLSAPNLKTKLIGFGAGWRGAVGTVHSIAKADDRDILKGDIRIQSVHPEGIEPDGSKPITYDGDCGAVFVDEQGTAWCMHHLMGKSQPGVYNSYGVPLSAIMHSHPKYFGLDSGTGKRGCWYPLKVVRRRLRRAKNATSRALQTTKKVPEGATSHPLKTAVSHQSSSAGKFSSFSAFKTKPVLADNLSMYTSDSQFPRIIGGEIVDRQIGKKDMDNIEVVQPPQEVLKLANSTIWRLFHSHKRSWTTKLPNST